MAERRVSLALAFYPGPGRSARMANDAPTADERAIHDLIDAWFEASRAGDSQTVLDLVTDDVVFLVPDREPFGKEAFAATAAELEDVQLDGTYAVQELEVFGDWAYLRNHIEVSTTPPDGPVVHRSGPTLTIFRKGPDGRWRLARDANLVTRDDDG